MVEIKIGIIAICSALFWLGGFSFLPARRFIMPSILTVSCLYFSHWDWWTISMLSCMGIFCLGYGEKSPLRHIFGDGWGRGIWGLLAALCLSTGLLFTDHLSEYWFIPYLLYLGINFTFENVLKNIPQSIGDPIIGLGFASILLIVR